MCELDTLKFGPGRSVPVPRPWSRRAVAQIRRFIPSVDPSDLQDKVETERPRGRPETRRDRTALNSADGRKRGLYDQVVAVGSLMARGSLAARLLCRLAPKEAAVLTAILVVRPGQGAGPHRRPEAPGQDSRGGPGERQQETLPPDGPARPGQAVRDRGSSEEAVQGGGGQDPLHPFTRSTQEMGGDDGRAVRIQDRTHAVTGAIKVTQGTRQAMLTTKLRTVLTGFQARMIEMGIIPHVG